MTVGWLDLVQIGDQSGLTRGRLPGLCDVKPRTLTRDATTGRAGYTFGTTIEDVPCDLQGASSTEALEHAKVSEKTVWDLWLPRMHNGSVLTIASGHEFSIDSVDYEAVSGGGYQGGVRGSMQRVTVVEKSR